MKRQPFAVEVRWQSRRTKTGWTKWVHYATAPTRESAERMVESAERMVRGLADWCREECGEVRIVRECGEDRRPSERTP